MFYTGIGSRIISDDVRDTCIAIAAVLADNGFILRSGGADGCDSAFETGCKMAKGKMEIYLPWAFFNKNNSSLILDDIENKGKAMEIAALIYKRWEQSTPAVKKLHARNVFQVIGASMNDNSDFVVYWSDRSEHDICGTMLAVTFAKNLDIPTFNLKKANEKEDFQRFLKEKYNIVI